MSSKRRLSQNLSNSANKLKLDSINKILKIDSVKSKKQRKDAISKQVSRIALSELMRNAPQEARLVAPDFKVFLSDDENVKVFEEFLKASYCQENLEFYLACERYRRLDPDRVGKQMIKFMATQIYNDFLGEDARQPININSSCIEKIKESMKEPQPDLLRDAQAEIYNLMKTDCYPRFCRTWQLDREMARRILARSGTDQVDGQSAQQASSAPIINRSQEVARDHSTSTIDRSHRCELFEGSYMSQDSTISSKRSRTPLNPNECPPECPYFRIGRLPCQRHEGTRTIESKDSRRRPIIDYEVDLKRIHQVPELCSRTKRSPSPPPLPPKPNEIDYKRIKTDKSYLPYVGKVFDV